MGRRGPPPKPTALRLLSGNPSRRPLNPGEPQPKKTRPVCPAWLKDEAKREWRRVVPELERLGLLTIVDRAELAGYCQAWARWQEAEQAIDKYGTVLKTPQGFVQTSPYVTQARNALETMRRFASDFGFSPSARSRVSSGAEEAPKDDFEEFLSGRRSG